MKKTITFIVTILVLLLTPQLKANDHTIRIAALLKTSSNPFFQLMWEGIKKESDMAGLDVELFWPERESDFEFQYEFLKNRAAEFDVLVLSPSNPGGVVPYLPLIKRAGIKIILLDLSLNNLPSSAKENDYFDAFIGTDNEGGGRLAAKYGKQFIVSKDFPQVVILGGFQTHMSIPGRTMMFEEEMRLFNSNIIFHKFTANYDRKTARDIVNENLEIFIESNLIFCANDHMALGVVDALLGEKVKLPPIIGYDSIKEAQQAILEGKMVASIVQFPSRMGSESIRAAVALLQDKQVERKILIGPEITVRRIQIETIKP